MFRSSFVYSCIDEQSFNVINVLVRGLMSACQKLLRESNDSCSQPSIKEIGIHLRRHTCHSEGEDNGNANQHAVIIQ